MNKDSVYKQMTSLGQVTKRMYWADGTFVDPLKYPEMRPHYIEVTNQDIQDARIFLESDFREMALNGPKLDTESLIAMALSQTNKKEIKQKADFDFMGKPNKSVDEEIINVILEED